MVSGSVSLRAFFCLAVLVLTVSGTVGCKVGPNYKQPPGRLQQEWMEIGQPGVQRSTAELTKWWEVLNDPVLNDLVERAYHNNPSLHAAAVRVLQAQAARGIAIGLLLPQQQEATGSFLWHQTSENAGGPTSTNNVFHNWDLPGLSVAWELDLWGRFRRGIEAADATVLASVANYDDVLVSLIAEVATDYVLLRTLEEQLDIVQQNLKIQQEGSAIVRLRREAGTATELDVAQAEALERDTESLIPATEASIRQTRIALCVLLGMPPQDISELVGAKRPIPSPPETVAMGVPADLLRRRPDIRRAEGVLAAQCANIGIAVSDLLPRFSLVGEIGLSAEQFSDLFRGNSFQAFAGPSFRWAILNYGRLINNVRVQDAAFQASISDYENLVLQAQGEAERAMAGLVGAKRQLPSLVGSVEAAARAVNVAQQQYKGGIADYIRVLVAEQFLITEQSRLVATQGLAAQDLVTLYRALGGGWELRDENDLVPADIKEQMRKRTYWGGMIDSDRVPQAEPQRVQHIEAAASSQESAL
jgi:NodT family efflux transporter outer membrane factor (OMF) lipoprotein